MKWKNINDLDMMDLVNLSDFIEALYEIGVFDMNEEDYTWLKNRIRHILEIIMED